MTKSWSRGSNWRFAVCGKWLYINSIIGRQRKMAPLTSAIGSFMSFLYDIYVASDMTVEVDDINTETSPNLFEQECGFAFPSN